MIKIAVLFSGTGSNFRTIAQNINKDQLTGCEITVGLTDKPECPGRQLADDLGIPSLVVGNRNHPLVLDGHEEWTKELDLPRRDYDILSALEHYEIDLVILAGYMRILHSEIVKQYKGRIINIHPSLLPSFPGLHAVEQALAKGVKVTGCTVHFVDEGVDTGPIILQKTVSLNGFETPAEAHAKIQVQELINRFPVPPGPPP